MEAMIVWTWMPWSVTAARDTGQVTANVYSLLATSLRSLAISLLSLASTIATLFLYLPSISLWGRILAYVPVHYYRFFSTRICFANSISRVYPFFPRVTSSSHEMRIQPSKGDIDVSFLGSTERWSLNHSLEQHYGSGVEFKAELAQPAHPRQWRRQLQVQNTTIRPCQWEKWLASDRIEFEYNS